jgi:hypothetical protein
MSDQMQCGMVSAESPFTIEPTGDPDVFVILFRKEYFGNIGWTKGGEKCIRQVVEWVNFAYQRGFADCGSKLMPLMKTKEVVECTTPT